jgi:triacylglycerol lipase
MRRIMWRLLAVAALLLAAVLTSIGPASAATTAPPPTTGGPQPPAVNACRPTPAHPVPVVLVHGTFENSLQNWGTLAPYLVAQGYCVWSLNYGNFATGRIQDSAKQLATFVDYVRGQTGAAKVDLVGHSQGGMMPRYYIKFLGGAAKVDKLIGLAPSNHGTTNPFAPYGGSCIACVQQVYQSPFIQHLNQGDETPGNVYYTVIETRYDEVVTPYTSAFLAGPASQVTNVLLQKKCPSNVDDHVAVSYDPVVFQWVLNALQRRGAPANPAFTPTCA